MERGCGGVRDRLVRCTLCGREITAGEEYWCCNGSRVCAGCLPELARQEPLPFLTLTKSLSVLSVMQRFELLLSVAQLLGLFALLTMLVCAAERMLGAVRRKNGMGSTGGVFCLLAFGGSFLAYRLPIWSWAVGAAIFWGVVPILTQVIVNIKKSEK